MNTENNLLQTREEEGGTYERALVASEFIDWLLQEGEMGTRAEAEQLGRRLLEHGIVQHGEASPGVTVSLFTLALVPTADQSTADTFFHPGKRIFHTGSVLDSMGGIVFRLILRDSVLTCHISG